LLNGKFNDSFNRFKRNLKSSGISIDAYCEISGLSVDSVKEDLRHSISDDIKLTISLLNISELLRLSFTKEEIDEYFDRVSKNRGLSVSLAKKNIPLSEAQISVLCDKAAKYVNEHASVKAPKKEKSEAKKTVKLEGKIEVKKEEKENKNEKKVTKSKKVKKSEN